MIASVVMGTGKVAAWFSLITFSFMVAYLLMGTLFAVYYGIIIRKRYEQENGKLVGSPVLLVLAITVGWLPLLWAAAKEERGK